MNGTVSVIIPTLNEQQNILRLIDIFKTMNQVEFIIADGGGEDGTCQLVEPYCDP